MMTLTQARDQFIAAVLEGHEETYSRQEVEYAFDTGWESALSSLKQNSKPSD